jgi:hypothetical protein
MLAGETRSLVEQHLFRPVALRRRRRTLTDAPGGPDLTKVEELPAIA